MQIAQQGSNRVYTRETDANGKTYIRVTGTNRDENRAFIYMARHFHALGLPVPELYSVSEDEMSYTQEDLGDTLLFDHLEPTLLERAIRALAHIQVTGAKNGLFSCSGDGRAFYPVGSELFQVLFPKGHEVGVL